MEKEIDLKEKIRTIPNFPKKGVMFRDITTLLKDAHALRHAIKKFVEFYKNKEIDVIVGAEARGFIFGSLLAHELGKGFIPIRKPGKLPFKTRKKEFETEYSTDGFEIHEDAIEKGEKVLIVDDLLATGGTSKATVDLIEELGGEVMGLAFLIELNFLNGRKKLKGKEIFSLIQYDSEE